MELISFCLGVSVCVKFFFIGPVIVVLNIGIRKNCDNIHFVRLLVINGHRASNTSATCLTQAGCWRVDACSLNVSGVNLMASGVNSGGRNDEYLEIFVELVLGDGLVQHGGALRRQLLQLVPRGVQRGQAAGDLLRLVWVAGTTPIFVSDNPQFQSVYVSVYELCT